MTGSIRERILPVLFRKKQVAKLVGLRGQEDSQGIEERLAGALVSSSQQAERNTRGMPHIERVGWHQSPVSVLHHKRLSLDLIRSRLVRAPMQGLHARATMN